VSDFAFDVVGVGLAGGGNVIGQGLKMARLADGPEAKVAAKSIWRSGIRHFFDLSDPDPHAPVIMRKPLTVHNPLDAVNDSLDRDAHLGVEPKTDASQHPFERAEWGMDKAGDGLDRLKAEIDKKKAELDKKSGGS
jgi:hypothetical protein